MSFQTQVNINQAPAVEGDFADNNPRVAMIAGAGSLIAAATGVTIARFAWANADGVVSNSTGLPLTSQYGFVPRRQQGLITQWLAESTMTIQGGNGMSLFTRGSFWGRFAAGTTYGQKVYFSYADGSLSAAATGAAATTLLTVNTTSGSAVITVTAGSGVALGQPVSGTGIPAGAYISALGTGTGGAGTYTISANATATGTGVTVTATTTKETEFKVAQTVAAGELAKFTSWGL